MEAQKTAICGNTSNCEPSSNCYEAQKWVPVKQRTFDLAKRYNRPVIAPAFTKLSIDCKTGLKGETETGDDIIRRQTASQYDASLPIWSHFLNHQQWLDISCKCGCHTFGDFTFLSFIHTLSLYDCCTKKNQKTVKRLIWRQSIAVTFHPLGSVSQVCIPMAKTHCKVISMCSS